jgi:hypothetical protein
MDDQRPNSTPCGRDVVGAWLICALIAALALGLSSDLHGGLPIVGTVIAEMPHRLDPPKAHAGVPDHRG